MIYSKYIILIILVFLNFNVKSSENSLTIQQQLERLQREVTDLSKQVFSNNSKDNNNNSVSNFSAIDMRIRDLEKDINSLNESLDEVIFQIDDLFEKLNNFDNTINFINEKISSVIDNNKNIEITSSTDNNLNANNNENNSLGTLKIETVNNSEIVDDIEKKEDNSSDSDLKPEDQFQLAMDSMRNKNWQQAKDSFIKFIEDNPSNQLSGSAYYWLGKLHILEKKYREAVITLAEGHEKFPNSIKAPEMLYDLSQSLLEINKKDESCKIMEILITNHPSDKLIKKTKEQITENQCLVSE